MSAPIHLGWLVIATVFFTISVVCFISAAQDDKGGYGALAGGLVFNIAAFVLVGAIAMSWALVKIGS